MTVRRRRTLRRTRARGAGGGAMYHPTPMTTLVDTNTDTKKEHANEQTV